MAPRGGGTVLAPPPSAARSLWADGLDFQPESGAEKDVAAQAEPVGRVRPGGARDPRCESGCWASVVPPKAAEQQEEPQQRHTPDTPGTRGGQQRAPIPKGARASRGHHVGQAHEA